MKKIRLSILMTIALVLGTVAWVAADTPEKSGIYDLQASNDQVTFTPVDAQKQGVTSASVTINDQEETFYPEAVAVKMNLSGTQAGGMYFVTVQTEDIVPTEKNVVYVDQKTAESGAVEFLLYPKSLTSGITYTVHLSSKVGSTGQALTTVGSFLYLEKDGATLLGDTNGDGKVDSVDVTVLARHVSRIESITEPTLLKNADVDLDDEVTSEDLAALAEYVSKIREEL